MMRQQSLLLKPLNPPVHKASLLRSHLQNDLQPTKTYRNLLNKLTLIDYPLNLVNLHLHLLDIYLLSLNTRYRFPHNQTFGTTSNLRTRIKYLTIHLPTRSTVNSNRCSDSNPCHRNIGTIHLMTDEMLDMDESSAIS